MYRHAMPILMIAISGLPIVTDCVKVNASIVYELVLRYDKDRQFVNREVLSNWPNDNPHSRSFG